MRLGLTALQKYLTGTTVKCLRGMALAHVCEKDLSAILD